MGTVLVFLFLFFFFGNIWILVLVRCSYSGLFIVLIFGSLIFLFWPHLFFFSFQNTLFISCGAGLLFYPFVLLFICSIIWLFRCVYGLSQGWMLWGCQ